MSAIANCKNSCKVALKGILAHPVLLVILCHAWIVCGLDGACNPVLAPVFAFLSVFIDRICKGRTVWSWILVPLYIGSCYIKALNGFDETVAFVVICVAIIPLCYLWLEREKEDIPFIRQAGASAWALIIALVSVSVLAGITALILLSIDTLFGVDTSDIMEWAARFCFIVLLAPIFISIDENRQTDGHSRTVEAILNWVMSPALIIYTLVLYAYSIKIAASWTLPDGQVAPMNLTFFIILFICRTYRKIQEKKPFEWFYRYSWIVSIPLFILFWTGTIRRFADYGCTSARYYLFLSGIILMFLIIRKERKSPSAFYHYFCVALSALFLISIACPGINHKAISMFSQRHIVAREAARLGILDADGRFADGTYECRDSLEAMSYRKIYQALLFMDNMDKNSIGKSFGIDKPDVYLGRLPRNVQQFSMGVTVPVFSSDTEDICRTLYSSSDWILETGGFKYVKIIVVTFGQLQELGLDCNESDFIWKQAVRCGWEGPGQPSFSWLSEHCDGILTVETEDFKMMISNLKISSTQEDSTWMVCDTQFGGYFLFNDMGMLDTLDNY